MRITEQVTNENQAVNEIKKTSKIVADEVANLFKHACAGEPKESLTARSVSADGKPSQQIPESAKLPKLFEQTNRELHAKGGLLENHPDISCVGLKGKDLILATKGIDGKISSTYVVSGQDGKVLEKQLTPISCDGREADFPNRLEINKSRNINDSNFKSWSKINPVEVESKFATGEDVLEKLDVRLLFDKVEKIRSCKQDEDTERTVYRNQMTGKIDHVDCPAPLNDKYPNSRDVVYGADGKPDKITVREPDGHTVVIERQAGRNSYTYTVTDRKGGVSKYSCDEPQIDQKTGNISCRHAGSTYDDVSQSMQGGGGNRGSESRRGEMESTTFRADGGIVTKNDNNQVTDVMDANGTQFHAHYANKTDIQPDRMDISFANGQTVSYRSDGFGGYRAYVNEQPVQGTVSVSVSDSNSGASVSFQLPAQTQRIDLNRNGEIFIGSSDFLNVPAGQTSTINRFCPDGTQLSFTVTARAGVPYETTYTRKARNGKIVRSEGTDPSANKSPDWVIDIEKQYPE